MKKSRIILIFITILIVAILTICFILYKINKNDIEISNEQENSALTNDIKIKEKYECNEFSIVTLPKEDLLTVYLNDYKNAMLNNPEKAYNLLNQEYREKRFGGLDAYKQYINANIEKFKQIRLNKYLINSYDNYEEYVCIDQYNNYYIFKVEAVMEYTLRLDTYTVNSKNFIDSYQKANVQEKVMLNIQKIISAINDKNYNYVYTKLDTEFKNNQYKTEQEFENFAQKTFFEQNDITYNGFNNEGNIYIYNVTINNVANADIQKKLTIIIKLKEENDFIMSFSFE